MPYISGTVRDDSGATVVRTIRFYRRDTGALLGSTDSSGAAVQGDQHFDKVSMLLHMDGADGSTTFTDSSSTPKAQTVAASGVALSAAQSKFGGVSALFNGGYIWFGAAGDAALAPGLQDFCIEAWCYDTGGGNRRVLFGNSAAGGPGATMSVLLRTNGTFSATVTTADAVQHNISPSTPTPLNQLYHLALVRSGTALKLFLDGTEIGSATGVTGSVSAGAGRFALGSLGEYLGYGGEYGVQWMGHVDDFRYTIGVARYTANFTPPTTAFPDTDITVPARALGEYHFPTDYTGEVAVVCLDDSGGALENDLILRAYAV